MLVEIAPHLVRAMLARVDDAEVVAFQVWWNGLSLGLPQINRVSAEEAIKNARATAAELGIEERPTQVVERDRLFLLAFALRLMPNMRGDQYLLSADSIFSRSVVEVRAKDLLVLARAIE